MRRSTDRCDFQFCAMRFFSVCFSFVREVYASFVFRGDVTFLML